MAEAMRIPMFSGVRSSRKGWARDRDDAQRQWSSIKTLDSPAWLREAYDNLLQISTLADNWDKCGGAQIATPALQLARRLLSQVPSGDLPKPHIIPLPSGGIGFHWRVNSRDLEVQVDQHGTISYLMTALGEQDQMKDGCLNRVEDAQDLLSWVIG